MLHENAFFILINETDSYSLANAALKVTVVVM